MRSLLPLLAAALLFAGCLQSAPSSQPAPTDSVASYMVPAQPKLDAAVQLADLKAFAAAYPERHNNLPGHEGARQWIAKEFSDAGLTVWRMNFTTGIPQADIIGIHWGHVRDQWVVVGGHYDTTHDDCIVDSRLPEPGNCAGHMLSSGAYDDGSGTMLSVELGKVWANVSSYYTVAFVAYDGEERGLQGAKAFVDNVTTGETPYGEVTIHGALDIDMFGITWPGTNAPTQILDNSNALHKVFQDKRKELRMPDDMYYCADEVTLGSSDFQEYFDAKIPVVFFSSDFGKVAAPGAPMPLPQFAYPFWHNQDTYDTMQAMAGGATQLQQGFQTAADLAAAELHALADTPSLSLDVHDPVTGPC
jgi:Zn-dependent M28 family amino/carboxypeptidase